MLEKKVIRKRSKKWPEPLVFKPGGNPTFFWLVPKGSHFLWFCVFCRFLKFLSSEEINQKRSAWGRDVSRYQWGFHITKNIVKNHEIYFFWKKQHFLVDFFGGSKREPLLQLLPLVESPRSSIIEKEEDARGKITHWGVQVRDCTVHSAP